MCHHLQVRMGRAALQGLYLSFWKNYILPLRKVSMRVHDLQNAKQEVMASVFQTVLLLRLSCHSTGMSCFYGNDTSAALDAPFVSQSSLPMLPRVHEWFVLAFCSVFKTSEVGCFLISLLLWHLFPPLSSWSWSSTARRCEPQGAGPT